MKRPLRFDNIVLPEDRRLPSNHFGEIMEGTGQMHRIGVSRAYIGRGASQA